MESRATPTRAGPYRLGKRGSRGERHIAATLAGFWRSSDEQPDPLGRYVAAAAERIEQAACAHVPQIPHFLFYPVSSDDNTDTLGVAYPLGK